MIKKNTNASLTTFHKISAIGFFPFFMIYNEVFLHESLCQPNIINARLAILLTAALAFGLMMNAIAAFVPNKRLSRILFGIFIFAGTFFAGMEYCLKQLFGIFFSISSAIKIAPEIVTNFGDTVTDTFSTYAVHIAFWLLPLILYLIFSKRIFEGLHAQKKSCAIALIIAAAAQLCSVSLCCFGSNSDYYFADFNTDRGITTFGLCTDAQLELTYAITGVPKNNYSFDGLKLNIKVDPTLYNVEDIDFEAKAAAEKDPAIQDIDRYVNSMVPSAQNEYTGIFKGKNIIMICVESFSSIVINEKLTPTLYQLTHEGFVFNDFYQPMWGQSTTGGEFSFLTGMIPTLVSSGFTFYDTINKDMYYTPGWVFRRLGYDSKAYHDGDVEFYNRHLTHPNMGYDYAAQGYAISLNGTVDPAGKLTFSTSWGPDDTEMFQQTLPALVKNYKENGTRFNAYYMTISGHGDYRWAKPMAQRNKDIIMNAYPGLSEPAGSYLAYNMDFERAMAYLIKTLYDEDIADDTVLCFVPDHYPYFLVEDADHYNELTGRNETDENISRYKNTLVIWSGSMVEDKNASAAASLPEMSKKTVIGPITIDAPACAIDVLPTLYNLFGITYDSRLFSGRDLLAPDPAPNQAYNGMPVAVIPTAAGLSWKTTAGTYDASTGQFTPNEGVKVDNNYVSQVQDIVSAKKAYVRRMIETDYFRTIDKVLQQKKQAEQETSPKK